MNPVALKIISKKKIVFVFMLLRKIATRMRAPTVRVIECCQISPEASSSVQWFVGD
jgi:hypothetical protein